MTAQVREDVKNIQQLLSVGAVQAVYSQYGPMLQTMLFVQDEAEWLEFIQQEGGLEVEPLELYLSAWRGECLLLGGYQGDATQAVLEYFKDRLPAELWDRLGALSPVVIDMDEWYGTLEKQMEPYQNILEPAGYALRIDFEDVYCAGAYFLSVKAQRDAQGGTPEIER